MKVFLMALFSKYKLDDCIPTLIEIEKILFRNRVVWFFDERNFANWGRDIYSFVEKPESILEDELEEISKESSENLDEENLASVNKKIADLLSIPISTQSFIQRMNYLYTYERGNKGFHRWDNLKYFLFEYEEHLKQRYKETNDKVDIDDFWDTSIEHVIPQRWWDNWSDTVKRFETDLEEDKLDITRKVLLNNLGNLTILKGGKNSSLGFKSWEDKKDRFSTGSYNEIDISKKDNWTHKEIMERGFDMLRFLAKKTIGLNFTEEEQFKLLFYDDFIIERFKK